MAVIYLKHPVHGHKVACSDIEANYDETHGWERYNPSTPSVEETVEETVEEVATEEAAPVNALETKTRRRKTTA
jgi:hypothetical protein